MTLDAAWLPVLALFGGTGRLSYAGVNGNAVRFVSAGSSIDPSRSEIVGVRRARFRWWMGIGWRAWRDTIGLIGSGRGLVEVELRAPQRARLLVIPWRHRRIAIPLQDPDAFIGALGRGAYAAARPNAW
jgi:hypothetical protein